MNAFLKGSDCLQKTFDGIFILSDKVAFMSRELLFVYSHYRGNRYISEKERGGMGSGVWPSMATHTQNLCSAFNPSKCTHTVVNIHMEQWAANAAAPGEQLGVRCLAQGSHLSRGIEGGESTGYSLPHLQSLPDLRLEPTTFGLQVQLSIH